MSIKNISLDIDYVRSQFPAFNDPLSSKWSFFENAGGSYVPQNVVDHLNNFMISTKVQPYASYEMSEIAGKNMDKATRYFSEMINAEENEIIIGSSTTMNMYVLSNAMKHILKPGDEVIVTNQDHEANIGAWRRLENTGAKIKEWQLNTLNGELEIEDLKASNPMRNKIPGILFSIGFLFLQFKVIFYTEWNISEELITKDETTAAIGELILTDYLLPFEVASIILLAALVGAALLSRKKVEQDLQGQEVNN